MSGERVLDALTGEQATRRACVICSRDLDCPGALAIRVGRSRAWMAVFACGWACQGVADWATPRARVSARAMDAAFWGCRVAVEAVGDTSRVSLNEMVAAAVHLAAPVIVATELRHLADEIREGIGALRHRLGYVPREHAVGMRDSLAIGVGTLRERAAQLDPAGGEPQ